MKITPWSLVLGLFILTGACTNQTLTPQTETVPATPEAPVEDLGVVEAENVFEAFEQIGPSILRSNLESLAGLDRLGHVVYNQVEMQGGDVVYDQVMSHYQVNGYASVSFIRGAEPGTLETVLYRLKDFEEGAKLSDITEANLTDMPVIGYFRFRTDKVINRTNVQFELKEDARESMEGMGVNYVVFSPANSLRIIAGVPFDNPGAVQTNPRVEFADDFKFDGSERVGRIVFMVVEKSELPTPKAYE